MLKIYLRLKTTSRRLELANDNTMETCGYTVCVHLENESRRLEQWFPQTSQFLFICVFLSSPSSICFNGQKYSLKMKVEWGEKTRNVSRYSSQQLLHSLRDSAGCSVLVQDYSSLKREAQVCVYQITQRTILLSALHTKQPLWAFLLEYNGTRLLQSLILSIH